MPLNCPNFENTFRLVFWGSQHGPKALGEVKDEFIGEQCLQGVNPQAQTRL